MPIKNLTDRVMLPRLGKIHLGVKVATEGGKEYPRAVDYFVCPPEVQKVYGEKPTLLDIMFPIDDEEKAASQFYRAYTRSRGLVCKGDGENAVRLVDLVLLGKTGEYPLLEAPKPGERVGLHDITCPGDECPDYQAKRCRAICNLQFLLPKVAGIGIWQIDTSSFNGMVRINSALRLLRATAGRIHGIPLTLALEPLEVSPDGKKKTVHVLNLRLPNVTLAEFQASTRQRQLPSPSETPTPDDEMPELLFPEQAGMVTVPAEPPAAEQAVQTPAPSAEASASAKAGPQGKEPTPEQAMKMRAALLTKQAGMEPPGFKAWVREKFPKDLAWNELPLERKNAILDAFDQVFFGWGPEQPPVAEAQK